MEAEAYTWHYLVAFGLFLAFGAMAHACRAIFNPLPDQFAAASAAASNSWSQRLFGTDYDAAGFYRLASVRNLCHASMLSGAFGLGMMLFAPGVADVFAHVINSGLIQIASLVVHRA